jgi:transcriptional regulator with XRE-family HTH domain
MLIGEKIQRLRARNGLSQADLAVRAGVGQSLLSRIERGSRPNPTADVLRKLAKALGCTTDYLVGMYEDEQDREPKPGDTTLEETTRPRPRTAPVG